MIKSIFIALAAVVATASMSGCTTTEQYKDYLTTQEKIANDYKAAANVNAIALQQIAKNSDNEVVQAVAAMALMNTAGRGQAGPMVAPPRNEALDWFRAATPLLGAWINGHFSLNMQENQNAADVQMYSTQINAFKEIAVEGIRKNPVPVVIAPAGSEVLVAPTVEAAPTE